ncbi:unnamed protein product [Heterobilharzia americana]|nr:unnamed protein product [Heterobilharzia americana]
MGLTNSSNKSESLQCLFDESETRMKTVNVQSCNPLRFLSHFFQSMNGPFFDRREIASCYSVSLLNHNFEEVRQGFIQVRMYHIVFRYWHNNRTVRLVWPLAGLRWYGSNKSIFVFQSGRRCKLGEALLMFKCGRPKMLVCRIEKQINLLSRLHSSANFTDESSDSTQQLYLDGVISTSVVTTASNGFSDLLSEENDESHPVNSHSLSSVVFACSSNDYLEVHHLPEQHSHNYGVHISSQHCSPIEPLLPRQIHSSLENTNYLELLPPVSLRSSDIQHHNRSDYGEYVIALASSSNPTLTYSVINSRLRNTCLNNVYVQDLV